MKHEKRVRCVICNRRRKREKMNRFSGTDKFYCESIGICHAFLLQSKTKKHDGFGTRR